MHVQLMYNFLVIEHDWPAQTSNSFPWAKQWYSKFNKII